MKTRKQKRCIQCDWTWVPRAKTPRQCPRCKRYDWHKSLATFIASGEPNQPAETSATKPANDPTNS